MVILSLSMFMFTMRPPVKAAAAQTIIWLCGDLHFDLNENKEDPTYGFPISWFYDAMNDTNNIDVDYVISTGDILSWRDPLGADTDIECNENWSEFYSIWNQLNVISANFSIGNHDGFFENYTTVPDVGYYYVDIGNSSGGIRVVFMCDEWTKQAWLYDGVDDPDHSGRGEVSGTQTSWVNSRVTEAYDDKSIFIMMHQRLDASGLYYGSEAGKVEYVWGGTSLESYMSNWQSSGKPYSLYACGHSHQNCVGNTSSDKLSSNYLGGKCLMIGSIAPYSGTAKYNPHPPCSRYLYLTEGSTTVTVKSYNHYTDSFAENYTFTFELLYAWDNGIDESTLDPPEFVSIDGKTNGSSFTDSTPEFIWNIVDSATQYQLQIARDSEFVDLAINISGINEDNYPSEYSENLTHVTFILPSSSQLPSHRNYYYRVRYTGDS